VEIFDSVFDSKGLRDEVFENKGLGGDFAALVVKELTKVGSWRILVPSLEMGTRLAAPIRSSLSRTARSLSVMALTDDL